MVRRAVGRVCGSFRFLHLQRFALSSSIVFAQDAESYARRVLSHRPIITTRMPDGTPIVSSYRLDLFLQGATAPFQSNPLGKPTPDPVSGLIHCGLDLGVRRVAGAGDHLRRGCGGGRDPAARLRARSPIRSRLAPAARTASRRRIRARRPRAAPQSVSVTAGAGCAWTASSNATWITVTCGRQRHG